jgi:hypothetical protein
MHFINIFSSLQDLEQDVGRWQRICCPLKGLSVTCSIRQFRNKDLVTRLPQSSRNGGSQQVDQISAARKPTFIGPDEDPTLIAVGSPLKECHQNLSNSQQQCNVTLTACRNKTTKMFLVAKSARQHLSQAAINYTLLQVENITGRTKVAQLGHDNLQLISEISRLKDSLYSCRDAKGKCGKKLLPANQHVGKEKNASDACHNLSDMRRNANKTCHEKSGLYRVLLKKDFDVCQNKKKKLEEDGKSWAAQNLTMYANMSNCLSGWTHTNASYVVHSEQHNLTLASCRSNTSRMSAGWRKANITLAEIRAGWKDCNSSLKIMNNSWSVKNSRLVDCNTNLSTTLQAFNSRGNTITQVLKQLETCVRQKNATEEAHAASEKKSLEATPYKEFYHSLLPSNCSFVLSSLKYGWDRISFFALTTCQNIHNLEREVASLKRDNNICNGKRFPPKTMSLCAKVLYV